MPEPKFSTWNWRTHPFRKTKGVCIGPWFGVVCYVWVPISKGHYGISIKFQRRQAHA